MTVSAATTVAREQEAIAMAALEVAAGDASLCALSRSGKAHPAAKFHEGAVAALAEARRALSRTESVDSVAKIRSDWQVRSARMAAPGPEWRAYYAGAPSRRSTRSSYAFGTNQISILRPPFIGSSCARWLLLHTPAAAVPSANVTTCDGGRGPRRWGRSADRPRG